MGRAEKGDYAEERFRIVLSGDMVGESGDVDPLLQRWT